MFARSLIYTCRYLEVGGINQLSLLLNLASKVPCRTDASKAVPSLRGPPSREFSPCSESSTESLASLTYHALSSHPHAASGSLLQATTSLCTLQPISQSIMSRQASKHPSIAERLKNPSNPYIPSWACKAADTSELESSRGEISMERCMVFERSRTDSNEREEKTAY